MPSRLYKKGHYIKEVEEFFRVMNEVIDDADGNEFTCKMYMKATNALDDFDKFLAGYLTGYIDAA